MTEWIPVTERMPEKEGKYLAVSFDLFDSPIIIIFNKDGWHCNYTIGVISISHWAPLPEMPKNPEKPSSDEVCVIISAIEVLKAAEEIKKGFKHGAISHYQFKISQCQIRAVEKKSNKEKWESVLGYFIRPEKESHLTDMANFLDKEYDATQVYSKILEGK